MATLSFRSIWISDVHLGTRDAQVEYLLDFLKQTRCDYLYLVGDIIDIWKMETGGYWPQHNNEVIRQVLAKANKGTQVVFVPGNHDELFRDYDGVFFCGVRVQLEAVHETADGRRLLVLHGDKFDCALRHGRWLNSIGSGAYDLLLWLNRRLNQWRRRFGFSYWSLSAYIKHRVRNAVTYASRFEQLVTKEARRRNFDGVICGHIHRPRLADFDGLLYANSGDWVENCTALAEDERGILHLIRWAEESAVLLGAAPDTAVAANA
jgi:UDP-2,3-diacylglucosamine pyrophosphatase LpxH